MRRFCCLLIFKVLLLLGVASAFAPSLSILQPPKNTGGYWSSSSTTPRALASSTTTTSTSNNSRSTSKDNSTKASTRQQQRKVAVLVCPAQFCVPDDYDCLFELLDQHTADDDISLVSCRVADLPRTEWIKVAKQLPTRAFWDAQLPVERTLSWYFDAIENSMAEILAEHHGTNDDDDDNNIHICIIGHSIGGWVARAYLGGMSRSSTAVHRLGVSRVSSLVTLGTPHQYSSETALVDQTRGLIAAIDATPSCSPQALVDQYNIDITCVCSRGVSGKFWTTNVEELVAASSYLPLTGQLNGVQEGDGIVPLDLAFLDPPARRVVLDECSLSSAPIRHCHVVPTPWNLINGYAPSIQLPKESFPSYVTEGVVHQWAKYIR